MYFAPECHAAYAALGFAPSPGNLGLVALPDGPAYFTSRGSLLGQVRPGVVAAAFGVFKPDIVSAGVTLGWSLTEAPTIFAARRAGRGGATRARARVGRRTGRPPRRCCSNGRSSRSASRAGRCSRACDRGGTIRPTPWTRFFHLGDMLRECRGDAHISAWSSVALDGVEIGLLNDIYMGMPLRSYVRTRGLERRRVGSGCGASPPRGAGSTTTRSRHDGREAREDIERATDRQMAPALEALGDDFDELIGLLKPWGASMRDVGAYVGGPVDLWPVRDD